MRGSAQFNGVAPNDIVCWDVNDYLLMRKTCFHHLNGRDQVGIAAYQNEILAAILVGIIEHPNPNANIGAFFFERIEESRSCMSAKIMSAFDRLLLEPS